MPFYNIVPHETAPGEFEPATRLGDLALLELLSPAHSGKILANWTAPSEDVWSVPIGLGLRKVVKLARLPVKIQLAVQYMPVHPRISGQAWNVQVQITPVIPKLSRPSCSCDAESQRYDSHRAYIN